VAFFAVVPGRPLVGEQQHVHRDPYHMWGAEAAGAGDDSDLARVGAYAARWT